MKEPRQYGADIHLPLFDDLFSSQQERDEAGLEKVQMLPIAELHPFPNHPFLVRDDEEMQKLVDSIQEHGVLMPAIARLRKDGGYEMVSGHRRMHASMRAGLTELPVLVREMDDDTAILLMVDSNVQRENILPSEKAKAYQMKLEALKRQGKRTDLTSCQVGTKLRSDEKIAQLTTDSARQIQRYISLNNLIPELMDMVDHNKLKFNPAVEISYLTPDEQKECFEYLDSQSCTPTLSQAQKLKAASRDHVLNLEQLERIMATQAPGTKSRSQQVTLPMEKIARFFPKNFSAEQITAQILHLLEVQYRSRDRGGSAR